MQRISRSEYLKALYRRTVPQNAPAAQALRSAYFLSRMDDMADSREITTRTFNWVPYAAIALVVLGTVLLFMLEMFL